ncbi:LRR receptor-like serine/threonine-protein kinase EFR [Raphanus sativus]|uniref:non-specific serine/threonine protein kinase n=1 Tax=Raphanus sativus TaxID=3726 RepID=A0A6J0M5B6_RAPSA|nr:LRR receptor-like serine/threonine-protein kinase EFR [Raphanus sativus]KAJ4888721.1 LRR receptor-like serine/threonine-protein kinase EFR [Raphanus sativus]
MGLSVHQLLLFLIFYVSTFSIVGAASLSLNTDREALLSFRSQIIHTPQSLSFTWDQNTSPCNWTGVTCNTRNRRVASINLSGRGLTGSISPSIGNLSFLRSLQLQNNQLGGLVPKEITNLFRLRVLNLSSNSLEGSLPSNLSKLTELRVLDLTSNMITGLVPNQLGDLKNLTILNLGKNLLHGPIPPSLSNISSLTILSLGTNSLSGPVPNELGRLQSLQVLDLTINNLSGTIPPSIYNMSSLESLVIASNNFWGQFPSNIGYTLPKLLVFNVCFNKFSGEIPSSLYNLTNIKVIRAAHNLLEGTIPSGLGNLPFLEMYNIGFNKLVWGRDQDLDSFIKSLSNSSQLHFLAFDGNLLEGVIPVSIGSLSKNLSKLFMGGNRFTGNIPESIGDLTGLTLFNISDNSITGETPQEIGKLKGLQVLELARNQLTGRIPDSFGDLGALNEINLSHNKLEGRIPPSFGNFKNMLSMDLSSNMLNGSIPNGVLNLPSLSAVLNLSSNLFSGLIPQDISGLESLVSLDLSSNNFSGHIPSSIKDCQSLEKLNMARNNLNGPIPDALAEVKGLEFLDLSSNQLSGVIPPKLQDLQAMEFLNISFNNLEGWVPSGGVFKDRSKAYMEGNPKLCIHAPCRRKTRTHKKVLKASIITCVVGLIAICVISFLIWKRKEKKSATSTSSSNSLRKDRKEPFMNVSYDELKRATDNFNPRNLLGVGSFGSVFKGVIRGVDVAVKVIDLKANGYYKGFIAECEALRNVRHRNLVKLVTSCSSIDFKNNEFLALVYEFLSNGSLEEWIKGKNRKPDGSVGLSLEERVNVAIDIASALDYLHNDCEVPVVHCDLKPSNILLTEDMVAKVGDFGLARVLFDASDDRHHASISSTHVLKGSIGYIPPEYGLGEKPSQAGDVYSFGVMLLELMSGKSPMDESFEGDQNLISWISYNFQSNAIMEVIDPKLMGLIDVSGAQLHAKLDCLKKTIEVGLACTAHAAGERMNMRNVLRLLKEAKDMLIKGI